MELRKKNFDLNKIIDNEIYIEEESIPDNYSAEELLKSTSWVDLVEEEKTLSESKTFKTSIKKETIVTDENTTIINILNMDLSTEQDSEILRYQTIMCSCLRKLLKINQDTDENYDEISYDDILKRIEWLISSAKYLSDRLGLNLFKHQEVSDKIIPRSSYKFCNYNFECQYNYNIKKHNGCFAQHYVHNLVYADLNALKNFILSNKNKNIKEEIIKEIRKSINTISYVIGHMYEELRNAEKCNFFNMKNQHIERTPGKKNKCMSQSS